MNPGEKEYSVWAAGGIGNECTCSGTVHGDPNCKIHGRLGKIRKADMVSKEAIRSLVRCWREQLNRAWEQRDMVGYVTGNNQSLVMLEALIDGEAKNKACVIPTSGG